CPASWIAAISGGTAIGYFSLPYGLSPIALFRASVAAPRPATAAPQRQLHASPGIMFVVHSAAGNNRLGSCAVEPHVPTGEGRKANEAERRRRDAAVGLEDGRPQVHRPGNARGADRVLGDSVLVSRWLGEARAVR